MLSNCLLSILQLARDPKNGGIKHLDTKIFITNIDLIVKYNIHIKMTVAIIILTGICSTTGSTGCLKGKWSGN